VWRLITQSPEGGWGIATLTTVPSIGQISTPRQNLLPTTVDSAATEYADSGVPF